MNQNKNQSTAAKRDWIRPGVQRLEAGAAESSHGTVPDGGGGNQGS
jgi:hypothetical protein